MYLTIICMFYLFPEPMVGVIETEELLLDRFFYPGLQTSNLRFCFVFVHF